MFNVRLVLMLAVLTTGVFAFASPRARAEITDDDLYGQARAPLGLTAALGVRSDLVRSAGLDAFSTTDGLAQSALSIGYRLGGTESSGVILGVEWNHGTTAATARGSEASLTMDRLTLSIEGRIELWRRLSGFARVAPGLLRDHASLFDASAPPGAYGGGTYGGLQQTKWVAAADVSAGLAFRFGSLRGRGTPAFGFWLTSEVGYAYAAAHDLVLTSRVETQPGRVDEPVRFGQLALRGAFTRFGLAVSF